MPEQEDGQPRLLLLGSLGHRGQVVDHPRPAVTFGEQAAATRRLAVAAMVVGVDRVPVVGQALREAGVAGAVLGQTVGDLHDPLRVCLGQPAVHEDLGAVCRGQREVAALHQLPRSRMVRQVVVRPWVLRTLRPTPADERRRSVEQLPEALAQHEPGALVDVVDAEPVRQVDQQRLVELAGNVRPL